MDQNGKYESRQKPLAKPKVIEEEVSFFLLDPIILDALGFSALEHLEFGMTRFERVRSAKTAKGRFKKGNMQNYKDKIQNNK